MQRVAQKKTIIIHHFETLIQNGTDAKISENNHRIFIHLSIFISVSFI